MNYPNEFFVLIELAILNLTKLPVFMGWKDKCYSVLKKQNAGPEIKYLVSGGLSALHQPILLVQYWLSQKGSKNTTFRIKSFIQKITTLSYLHKIQIQIKNICGT